MRANILFIVGPTASGKSDLAMYVAKTYDGEIICADSQTLHKHLDIGTAKPSVEDQKEVPHHMLDVIGPYDTFNVSQFQQMAEGVITDIQSRGRLPIVVGGTGLYIDSLFYEYDLPSQSDLEGRDELEAMSVPELQLVIQNKGYEMPVNNQNPRHLVGAILRSGKTAQNTTPREGALIVGMLPNDDTLKARINARVEHMFAGGFLDEVRAVAARYGAPDKKMDAIGYPIAMQYLDGALSLEDAKKLFKRGHWQYARRQKAWFKRNKSIQWASNLEDAITLVDSIFAVS